MKDGRQNDREEDSRPPHDKNLSDREGDGGMKRKLGMLLALAIVAGALCAAALAEMEVRFLDVGRGDAILVLCDGEAALIDGGDASYSSFMYAYLKERGIDRLNWVVCTHAHEDRAGGLAGALNYASAGAVLAPVPEDDGGAFRAFAAQAAKQGLSVETPEIGDRLTVGGAEAVVLGVYPEADANNSSIVLRLTYGDTSFLLMGDAGSAEEARLLDGGADLRCDVLKVAHYGAGDSTGEALLKAAGPGYAVISAGSGDVDETLARRLADAGAEVYRTDTMGTIVCVSDGSALTFILADAGPMPQRTAEAAEGTYILNTNTKKFHLPDCGSVEKIKEGNRQEYAGDRETLLARGYSPCGSCKP